MASTSIISCLSRPTASPPLVSRRTAFLPLLDMNETSLLSLCIFRAAASAEAALTTNGAEPKGRRARLEAAMSSSTAFAREGTVVGAVEAAVRSAGGGPGSSSRPIAVGVPDSVGGAAAVKVRGGGGGGE